MWEEGEPANFEARFEYRFVEAGEELSGNSGFQFRSERFTTEDKPNLEHRVRGNQVDFAVSDWIPGLHYEEQKRGILARRGQRVMIDSEGETEEERFAEEAELGKYIVHNEWNQYHVYANEDTIRAKINDQLMHEIIDQSSISLDQGILAFQLHVGPPMRVELRNVELKILD
ncbi:MAG: family 16 glycoside hydrolase [Balneolaceae bacterium]|nr:family 16 glycoside hydrolase [Balneolaceae bacterium]